jgi:hypothetical protein
MPLRDQTRQADSGQLTSVRDLPHPAAAAAGPPTDIRQRTLAPDPNTLAGARAHYVAALQGTFPVIDAQLSDVVGLLDALLGVNTPPGGGPLVAARAAYLSRLRQACPGLNEQVLELARACTELFAPALGLRAPTAPPVGPP